MLCTWIWPVFKSVFNTTFRKSQKTSGKSSSCQFCLCTCMSQFYADNSAFFMCKLLAVLWDESLTDGYNPFIGLWIIVLLGQFQIHIVLLIFFHLDVAPWFTWLYEPGRFMGIVYFTSIKNNLHSKKCAPHSFIGDHKIWAIVMFRNV